MDEIFNYLFQQVPNLLFAGVALAYLARQNQKVLDTMSNALSEAQKQNAEMCKRLADAAFGPAKDTIVK